MQKPEEKLSEKIQEYLETVCGEIRWKEARYSVQEELKDHILSQKETFLAEGKEEEEAEEMAITEMGDGVGVGIALDRIHRPISQWQLMIPVGLLLLFGAASRIFIDGLTEPFRIFLPVILGLLVFLASYFLDFTVLYRYGKGILSVTAAVLFLLFFFFAVNVDGATFFVFGIGFSVSFFAVCLLFPLLQLIVIGLMRGKGRNGFWICVTAAALGTLFLVTQSTVYYGLLFAAVSWVSLFLAVKADWFGLGKEKGRRYFWGTTGAAVVLGMMLLWYPPVRYRLSAALWRMSDDVMGSGFLHAIAGLLWENSCWFGMGKMPEGQWGEILSFFAGQNAGGSGELLLARMAFLRGKWTVLLVMAVFLFFFIWSFRQIGRQKSFLGRMTAVCIWLILLYETAIFFVFNLGLMFVAASSLPLVSYGNSMTVCNAFLMGMMLSVFRRGDVVQDKRIAAKE